MIKFPLWALFIGALLAIGLVRAPIAIAGHELGNGGDYLDYLDIAAWSPNIKAYGHKNVPNPRWCVEHVAEDFPVPLDSVKTIVERSFQTWKAYVRRHIPYPEVISSYEFSKDCTHSQVRFRFGGDLSLSTDPKNARIPLAFAQPEREIERNQFLFQEGFVWIGATYRTCAYRICKELPWSDSGLEAIVLHEIGHILGIGHIENTVMRPDIGNFIALRADSVRARPALAEIDHEAMLYPLLSSRRVFSGEFFPENEETDPPSAAAVKAQFVDPNETAVKGAELVFIKEGVNAKGLRLMQFELRAGKKVFPFQLKPQVFTSTGLNGLFYETWLSDEDNNVTKRQASARIGVVPASEMHFGLIKVGSGTMPALLLVNMSTSATPSHVSILAVSKDGLVPVFRSIDPSGLR